MKCREMLKLLSDYLDRDLSGVRCRDLDAHLKDCPPCIALINTLRATREILKRQPKAAPSGRLRAALRRRLAISRPAWRACSAGTGPGPRPG